MKSINFINPVPPKKQRGIILWFYSSLILSATCITFLGYFHIYRTKRAHQLAQDLHELKIKSAEFDEYSNKKRSLQKNRVALEDQLKTLRSFHNHIDHPHALLAMLAALTPSTICLSSIEGNPGKSIVIEGLATNAHAATQFLNKLNNGQQITDLKLSLLVPSQEKSPQGASLVQFKYEGSWKFNHDIIFED